ncbi:hypothetical protein LTR53_004398 [Teratosphaeriaceae sp. CCFEE 6253]|nr:hypothetical protein LTR53_004398 [Teratosphaeriaceae sp. CCFEE 6253]
MTTASIPARHHGRERYEAVYLMSVLSADSDQGGATYVGSTSRPWVRLMAHAEHFTNATNGASLSPMYKTAAAISHGTAI